MTLARVVLPETLDELPPEDPAARRSRRDLVRVHLAMGTRGIAARAWARLLDATSSATSSPDRGANASPPVARDVDVSPPAARDPDSPLSAARDPDAPPFVARDADAPLRILELGAGDGTLALAVARRLADRLPPVRLTLLDRQDIVAPATLAAFTELGWRADVEIVDVLDWATFGTRDGRADGKAHERTREPRHGDTGGTRHEGDDGSGEPARPWDLIVTALFLHHFEGPALASLLAAVAARGDAFHAFEPRRDRAALLGSHLIGALGTNAVTRHDAVLSVRAGFRGRELSAAWPGESGAWRLDEGVAGPFGHGFAARRVGRER